MTRIHFNCIKQSSMNIPPNIFCIALKKEMHAGLKQSWGESIMTLFEFHASKWTI